MRVFTNESYTLTDFNVADGVWTADSAPMFYRKTLKLRACGTVAELEENDTFYAELWKGEFEGLSYFMRVIRKHDDVVDCAWLTKDRKFLRSIHGGILFSDIPENTVVYHRRNFIKRKFEEAKGTETPAKKPKRYRVKRETVPVKQSFANDLSTTKKELDYNMILI